MAVSYSRGRSRTTENGLLSRKWKETIKISPERNKVWIEPTSIVQRKVSVVYYLSRNGQLQHPHFMEVPLSSNAGLYLKDVINRLNLLRGKGMANLYSWSSKRSYKNGFVWNDLAENDFIYPSHGQEYVLKGSEILDHSINHQNQSFEITSSEKDHDSQLNRRPRDPPRRSIDFHEYKVYASESSSGSNGRLAAADALTQTDDKRMRRKPVVEEPKFEKLQSQSQDLERNQTTELSRDDISPPPSDSSSETLESLMKADARAPLSLSTGGDVKEDNLNRSGRMKASSVLRQLISCGSISVKECGPNLERNQGFSLIGHYKSSLPRGAGQLGKEAGIERELGGKEYFSGSLIETKREVPDLKRSSSCNSERSSQLQLADNETTKKQGNMNANSCFESGSKRQGV